MLACRKISFGLQALIDKLAADTESGRATLPKAQFTGGRSCVAADWVDKIQKVMGPILNEP